jgi:hypothetical protein
LGQSQFTITEANRQAIAESIDTNDQRLQLMWKGDHSLCELGHANGLCRSVKAWSMKEDFTLFPTTWARPTNQRFSVFVHYEKPGQEKESEPLWQSKGYRHAAESKRVLPVPDVIRAIRERSSEAFKNAVDRDKNTTIAQKRAEVQDWLDRFDKANADAMANSEKRIAAILDSEKEERDQAAIRAAEAAGLTVATKPSREKSVRG